MVGVNRLIVSLDFGHSRLEVGELVMQNRKIYFKYYQEFLRKGIHISPFKLPLSDRIQTLETDVFEGLFGVFNDSLPDGWGRLLVDRKLLAAGINLAEVSPLDRLAIVGKNGMGALTYEPALESKEGADFSMDLDDIALEARNVLQGQGSAIIESLVNLGGSSGGARPKVFVKYNPETDRLSYGEDPLPEGYEDWIIKFPSSNDPVDVANIEFAYYRMALASGLKMSPSRLFEGKSGKVYFGTKRFDRTDKGRLHMHSASGLMHDNFRLSNLDYGHLMDAAFRLENSVEAYEKVLRMAAFNVFSHNRDDHSNNFSFLMDKTGRWQLSPVYDLTFSYSSHGFHSTTVAGEGKNPGSGQLKELAEVFGVRSCINLIEQVKETISQWPEYAREADLTRQSKNEIGKILLSNLKL